MATTVRKRQTGRDHPSGSLVSRQRKREVLGLILMVASFLLALAILTYNPSDDPVASRFDLESVIEPANDSAWNALGPVGAVLARWLVPGFLGYGTLLFALVLLAWGYHWFRNRPTVHMPMVTSLTSMAAFFLAAVFGWFAVVLELDLLVWSGVWGLGIAEWLIRILGRTGSLSILVLSLVIVALLLVDRDIQESLDRVEGFFRTLRERLRDRRIRRREEKAVAHRKADEERRLRESAPSRPGAVSVPASDSRSLIPLSPVSAPSPRMTTSEPGPRPSTSAPDVKLHVVERVQERSAPSAGRTGFESGLDQAYHMPSVDLLDEEDKTAKGIDYEELEENKQILLRKLETYGIEITGIGAVVGPTVTLYELTPAPGVKISRITALENDLAMAMAARGIRMIAPIPGKTAIGVEIPNRHRELVHFRAVVGTEKFRAAKMELPLILGKSIEGEVVLQDLTKMPHVLIAGATGSGKSVGLNTFIAGLLYACPPSHLKFVMIDPKKIELAAYARIEPHYIAMPPEADSAIITDFAQALGTLKSCEREMDARYDLLAQARVRSLKEYNSKFDAGDLDGADSHRRLPYIVVVVDELADLMMTAGKDIEAPIARLAQMARAVGIHLILATQRPSVDVITGLIKANFPARIAFQVASKIDSRTILDQNGAEGLVGNGDMLYMLGSRITRLQGPFVSEKEVERLTEFIGGQPGDGPYHLPSLEDEPFRFSDTAAAADGERDELFDEAARIIVRSQQGSVSLLQRKLSVGYSRAARLVDQLEDAGVVGPFEGSKARQVRVADETELDTLLNSL